MSKENLIIDYNGDDVVMIHKSVCRPGVYMSDDGINVSSVFFEGRMFDSNFIIGNGLTYFGLIPNNGNPMLMRMDEELTLVRSQERESRLKIIREVEENEAKVRIDDLIENIAMPANSLLVLRNEDEGAHEVLGTNFVAPNMDEWKGLEPLPFKRVLVYKFTQASMCVMGVGTVYIVPLEDVAAYLKK